MEVQTDVWTDGPTDADDNISTISKGWGLKQTIPLNYKQHILEKAHIGINHASKVKL